MLGLHKKLGEYRSDVQHGLDDALKENRQLTINLNASEELADVLTASLREIIGVPMRNQRRLGGE